MKALPIFSLDELQRATAVVRDIVSATPTYPWPLLQKRTGVKVFVKHENHTPTGAFKVRGGLVYVDALRRSGKLPKGIVSATRGNHGQSLAVAAAKNGIPAVIVVPRGNSPEKNAAMEGFGAELIIAGADFDESRGFAAKIAEERGFHFVPAFHVELVKGVATYAHELFSAVSNLAAVYAPVGMGSGLCALIAVRDLLGLKTEIVGVVSEGAPAFALSFEAGLPISTPRANTFADGMATRDPQQEPFALIKAGASRIVRVTDTEIAEAIRVLYTDTHNVSEGAGAAPLAALTKERARYQGKNVAVVLSGGNIDASRFAQILSGQVPEP